jgi:transposase InsO family protein
VEERLRFVLALEAGEESVSLTCRRFGISRKTGEKWRERYRLEGLGGLADRSRAPLHRPIVVAEETWAECLAVRRAHPSWGPLKVRTWLERRDEDRRWPAASSIGLLFDREGLTVKRKLRRRAPPMTSPFGSVAEANETWCIDFKGWFRTGDGWRCGPLTLSDAASRYLLRCQALGRDDGEHVWPVLEAAFREYGLPLRLRSDNGAPFASTGAGGLSRLAVKVIKAGVLPERIEPGKPQQNGRLERLHLTLLQDTATPPAKTLHAQARRFANFQRLYNDERPHQALKGKTPAQAYAPSPRRFDGILREPTYEPDAIRRRVRTNGEIKCGARFVYIGAALKGEPVGLFEQEDGSRQVFYGPILLGRIEHKGERLVRPKRATRGLVDNPGGFPTTPPAQQQQQA